MEAVLGGLWTAITWIAVGMWKGIKWLAVNFFFVVRVCGRAMKFWRWFNILRGE